jgi:hypothetical protein
VSAVRAPLVAPRAAAALGLRYCSCAHLICYTVYTISGRDRKFAEEEIWSLQIVIPTAGVLSVLRLHREVHLTARQLEGLMKLLQDTRGQNMRCHRKRQGAEVIPPKAENQRKVLRCPSCCSAVSECRPPARHRLLVFLTISDGRWPSVIGIRRKSSWTYYATG